MGGGGLGGLGGLGGMGGGGGLGGQAGGTARGCHDYVIIESRGTTEPQGPSVGFRQMIQKTLSTLPNGASVATQYPATPDFAGSPPIGARWVLNYLRQGIASCPKQKYALLGYSQGAMASWQAAGNINKGDPLYNAIKAILLIGDPYRTPGLPGNVDGNGGKMTEAANGIGRMAFPSAKMLPWAQDGKVLDFCIMGDTICMGGGNIVPHLGYGGNAQVQNMAAQFLVQKLRGRDSSD
ncbi:unnamed protein product [Tilletia controversa]|nr:unnamed protein product [Tilletia laevis]CAD6959086.1 unnamed protein product [Tilletia controversa]